MNIPMLGSLVPKAIAVAMAGAVVGAGVTQLAETEPEIIETPIIEEASVVEEPTVEPEPETPAEAPQSPQESASRPQTPSVPSTPIEPTQKPKNDAWKRGVPDSQLQAPDEDHIATLRDFETIYMGWCPKDVPAEVWPDKLSPLVALGYYTNMGLSDYSVTNWARWVWNQYKSGHKDASEVSSFALVEWARVPYGDSIVSKSGYYFAMDWSTKTVFIDGHLSDKVLDNKEQAALENAAARMTSIVRDLEARYIAKCGN